VRTVSRSCSAATTVRSTDDGEEVGLGAVVDPGEGLVEQDEPCLLDEKASEECPL
jgi:hypothetical protein